MSEMWGVVINQFERVYPHLAKDVVDWYPSGYQEITLKFNNGDSWVYNHIHQRAWKVHERKENIAELSGAEWNEAFGKKLKNKMQLFGMTQEQLSYRTGISQVTISKYIQGKATPSTFNCKKIAKALRCSISELADF